MHKFYIVLKGFLIGFMSLPGIALVLGMVMWALDYYIIPQGDNFLNLFTDRNARPMKYLDALWSSKEALAVSLFICFAWGFAGIFVMLRIEQAKNEKSRRDRRSNPRCISN